MKIEPLYHYGSYATTWSMIHFIFLYICFHTTMVLTQPDFIDFESTTLTRFPYHYGSYATWKTECDSEYTLVSIPLWFLRNVSVRNMKKTFGPRFPYHYGSYATQSNTVGYRRIGQKFPYHYGSYATCGRMRRMRCSLRCFHTTMVLTQQIPASAPTKSIQVSIPLWFLRNQSYKM